MQNEQTPAAGPLTAALDEALTYIEKLGENIERNDVDMHLDTVERPFSFAQTMRSRFDELCRPHVASPASSSSVVQGDAGGVEREVVTLAECPPGLFLWNGMLGFKSEYGAMEPVGDNMKFFMAGNAPDAYCADSGEVFWGGTSKHKDRVKVLVRPVQTTPAILAALRPQPSGETRDCPHGLHSVGSCSDCSVNRSMDDQPHAPVSRPAGEGERESVAILKGVGKITGDGWKDTTTKGDVVFVWSAERPSPYAPGQYPRIGNEGWSASTSQYDFTPATADDVPAILSLLSPAAPDTGGGDERTQIAVEALERIAAATPGNTNSASASDAFSWTAAVSNTALSALQPGGER